MLPQRRLGLGGHIVLLISVLRTAVAAGAGGSCPFQHPLNAVVTTVFVLEYQIAINTDVQKNTSFAVNTDLTITVDNAPTSLDFTTTYTERSTVVRTAAGEAVSGSIIPNVPFVLTIKSIASKQQRRGNAVADFVGAGGVSTTSCTDALTYTLVGGQLFAQVNGTTQQFSTDGLSPYATFVPSSTPGAITTTFSLDRTGTLLWTNGTFYNGNALFCLFSSGTIVAVFQQNAQPSGCVFINLNVLQLPSNSSCQYVANNPGPSGPPGPPGPQGVQGIQGIPGSTGVPGPQGIQGIQGISGSTGVSGIQGIQGFQGIPGSTGVPGPQGIQGVQGIPGSTGVSGPQGIQGVQGIPGSTGVPGPQGIQGVQGIPGSTGVSGFQGIQGVQGIPGSTGVPGPQGIQGIQGIPGSTGVPGPQGSPGIQGVPGSTGVPGPQGIQGIQGVPGVAGATGPVGPTGPVGATGIAFAYLGCFYQPAPGSVLGTGRVLSAFQITSTAAIDQLCSSTCNSQNYGYFGTVNNGAGSGDCYCGNVTAAVTVAGLGSGATSNTNCGACNVGAGQCGTPTSNTIAIYARSF